MFTDWMAQFREEALEWEKINVDFNGYQITREYTNFKGTRVRAYRICEPEGTYASTGCYGHDAVNGVLLKRLFDRFDRVIEDIDVPIYQNPVEFQKREKIWDPSTFHILEFIFDPNAVIIQYTDEYTDEGFAEMKQHIKKYIEMNDYCCDVIWPVGG
jgi:hypothetical protein